VLCSVIINFYFLVSLIISTVTRPELKVRGIGSIFDSDERISFSEQRMGEERGCVGSWWGNRRERDHWGDLGLYGWIILGWISRRWDVAIWTGLGWPRIGTVGGRV